MFYFRFAFLNLLRHRGRALSTLIAIALGFAGTVMIANFIKRIDLGIYHGFVHLGQQGHLGIFKAGGLKGYAVQPKKFSLDPQEQKEILEILKKYEPQIEQIVPRISTTGLISEDQRSFPAFIVGFDPEKYASDSQRPEVVRWSEDWIPTNFDFKTSIEDPNGIAVAAGLSRLLKGATALQVAARDLYGDLNVVDTNVHSSYTTGNVFQDQILVRANVKLVQELLRTDHVHYFAVFLNEPQIAKKILLEFKQTEHLKASYDAYDVSDEAWHPYIRGTMSFLFAMGIFLGFLLMGTVALAIINTVNLNILERTREIGTLRALGMKPRQINWIFIAESFWLSLIGIFIGGSLAFTSSAVVNYFKFTFLSPGQPNPNSFYIPFLGLIAFPIALIFVSTVMGTTLFTLGRKNAAKPVELLSDKGV